MKKISSLARAGIAHKAFGNPIPQEAYNLIELTEQAVQQFNPSIDKLRKLMGYVENGTDKCIHIFQDDATGDYYISCYTMSQRQLWSESASSFESVIEIAYEKHHEESE